MISILSSHILAAFLTLRPLLAQAETDADNTTSAAGAIIGGIVGLVFVCVALVFGLFILIALWKVFTKAGQPGWAILIPIYNIYIMCKIAGRPGWWLLLFPLVIPAIIVCIDIAKRFGKGTGFGLGLAFLGIIFWPILGFGSAQYQGAPATTA